MKKIKKLSISLLLIIIILFAYSSFAFAGSEATCIFLLIEPGSRPNGLGHSYVSIAQGGFAAWWNPGGLAFQNDSEVGLMHSNWFGDIIDDMYYEYLGYSQYFEGIGTLGLNVTYMTYGEQEAYDAEGHPLQKFTSYEIAVGAAYGTKLNEKLGLGVNLKGVISGLAPLIDELMDAEGTGYTFVMDIGMLKKDFFLDKLDFGVNLQNFGPDMSYANSDSKQPMPLNLKLGLSYRIFDNKYNKLTATADINKMLVNNDPLWKRIFTSLTDDDLKDELDSMIQNFGVEYKYYNLISLRVGYVNDVAGHIQGFSFGGGISYEFSKGKELYFDFALQPAGELTTNNKTFSLGVTF
ncbi:MAG TPA: PorV/PorQ family protein [Candidatus Cloacimonetes bacterium]|nr:PorV/PorQ family protein [Candidatus Cloacimonadota bacterium]HEX38168.1 PorV/PorQ family protein [Candidatus Cloacimonadota bacterium]